MKRAACILLLLSSPALAQMPIIENENRPRQCIPTPTPPGAGGSYPGRERIEHSNKLAKPAGKAVYARGEIMVVLGRVLDENCVPIEGASIELWQTDTDGKYKWEKKGNLLSPSPAFAGTGQAMSNNLGEYEFLTVFPGVRGKRAPHLNIRVTHPDFGTLATEIFFEGDHRNGEDPRLNSLPSIQRDMLQAAVELPNPYAPQSFLTARFNIVLSGHNKFKGY